MISFLGHAVSLITLLYLFLALVLFLAPYVLPSEYGGFIRTLLVTLCFVALVLLPLCLLFRQWRVALLAIVPIIGLVLVYGSFLLPRRTPPVQSPGVSFSVLTFNLQGATDSLQSLATAIEEADADIVGVQELSRAAADHFEAVLGEKYPYFALHPQDNPTHGQGVLSRYPILSDTYWQNDQLDRALGHMRAEIDLSGSTVVIYNTHPTPPFSLAWGLNLTAHSSSVAELLRRTAEETGPVLMVGDFNMTDQFAEYQQITGSAGFADAFREVGDVGFGFTFPAGNRLPLPPLIRLDYVFHSRELQAHEARVWRRSGASDHLPVFARLSLRLNQSTPRRL